MAKTAAPVQSQENPVETYADFSGRLSWKVNELVFRLKAAREYLVSTDGYDEASMVGVDYLLTQIADDADEVADALMRSEIIYVARCAATSGRAAA